jgi:hypothetical protein
LVQGEAVRHSNVDVDMTSLSPGNDGEEPPWESQEWETGTSEMEELEDTCDEIEVSEDAGDDESLGLVVGDQQPGFGTVKGAAKKVSLPAAGGKSEEDDDTVELFPSPPSQEIGNNKRDASGGLLSRKLDGSATSYKQTLTLSNEPNKVSCNWGGTIIGKPSAENCAIHNTFVNLYIYSGRERKRKRG